MSYEIEAGQTKAVLDDTATPLAAAGITSVGGALPPYGPGLAATMGVNGDGFLVVVGNFEGTVTFVLTRNGTTATHDVTVTPAPPEPFDWSLED